MSKNIIWLDVETTGVDERNEKLLQVALLVTDEKMNILPGSEFEVKIKYSAEEVEAMKNNADAFVVNMHSKTGLWELLTTEGVTMVEAEEQLLAHVKQFAPEARTARMGGNSITLDRNFIRENMPELSEHFHYRSFDATTISEFALTMAPAHLLYQKPASTHEAMQDIRDSVGAMKYYRNLFLPLFESLVEADEK